MVKYFWDSYAVVEVIKGNPSYARYIQEPVVITIFNLAEIYWAALNDLGEKGSDEIYTHYKQSVVEIDDEILKDAIKLRKKHKSRDLSYADCIGYFYAIKNNMKFLTGDKEFQGFENVEFAK